MLHLSKRIKGKENVELMRHDMIQSSCKLQQMTFYCIKELKGNHKISYNYILIILLGLSVGKKMNMTLLNLLLIEYNSLITIVEIFLSKTRRRLS